MDWFAQKPHPACFPKVNTKALFRQILLGVERKERFKYGLSCNIAIAQRGGLSPR